MARDGTQRRPGVSLSYKYLPDHSTVSRISHLNIMKTVSCLLALTGLSAVTATLIVAVPTITVTTNLATTLAALGVIKLKAAAILALTRSKRSANKDGVFQEVSQLEDQQCVRRFLCEIASGELSAPDYLQAVKHLQTENLNALVGSAELPYSEAVKYGAQVKSGKQCQAKYQCPQTGLEILLATGLRGA